MKTSDSTKEIYAALAKAQAVMAGAKKDANNPHYKSKYADLASVWEACRKALTDNGIAVIQMTDVSDKDEIIVETRLGGYGRPVSDEPEIFKWRVTIADPDRLEGRIGFEHDADAPSPMSAIAIKVSIIRSAPARIAHPRGAARRLAWCCGYMLVFGLTTAYWLRAVTRLQS